MRNLMGRVFADLNKAMNFMEKVWRRLVEMIVTLQKDILNKT